MKIGTDIEDIERFETIDKEKFCDKYFTGYEKEYSLKKGTQSLAGIFSCKEAVLKAFGIGIGRGINLKDISLKHNEMGKPYIEINEVMSKLLDEYGFTGIDVSISHTKKNCSVSMYFILKRKIYE